MLYVAATDLAQVKVQLGERASVSSSIGIVACNSWMTCTILTEALRCRSTLQV